MNSFLHAHARGDTCTQALERCLEELAALPHGANLGFVYATDACAGELAAVVRRLKQSTGIQHWVGTLGVGVCASGQEYYDEPALAVMAAALPPDAFRIIRSATDSGIEPGEARGLQFAVVHGDPRNGQLPRLIGEFPERLGEGFLVGGLTSSRSYFYQVADELTEGQLSGVVLNDVPLVTGLTQGCSPVGPVREITECQGNIAVRIDDKPALEVLYEDIGEILARDPGRIAGYIFAGFPIPGSDTGDYLVRNLLGLDLQRNLLAIGERLSAGDRIMFCRRDGQTAVEDLRRMLSDVAKRLPSPPKGALYYSCLGRGRSLFGEDSEELKLIGQALGDLPLVGFYANGEISGNRLYGYTGVLTLFL